MNTLLEIKGLTGGYEYGEGHSVLKGISFSLPKGQTLGVIGINGSGKSTLGKALMNMLPYRFGEIKFNQHSILGKSPHELSRQGIAYMHQGGVVFQNLSVWENLRIAYGHNKVSKEMLETFLPLFSHSETALKRMRADKLSGGEVHELALAMTLASNPTLVILDEPSAGLSPSSVESMYNMLDHVRETSDVSMIIIEQNVAKALSFCDRCLLLKEGIIAEEFPGRTAELQNIENKLFND